MKEWIFIDINILDFHFIMGKKKTTEEFIKECKDKNRQ